MISQEPVIHVGILERASTIEGAFGGPFGVPSSVRLSGAFSAVSAGGRVVLKDASGVEVIRGESIVCRPSASSTFLLKNVVIGIQFHWERKEEQVFEGGLRLVADAGGTITAINEIGVESYLRSVISSEMSAEAPIELLRAHAVTSRSWLVAMLNRQKKFRQAGVPSQRFHESGDEIVRWYDREDHHLFDVCADDHCQRYHGVTKIISRAADEAVRDTNGLFLVHGGEICDARFYKACGGRTELFENSWEDTPVAYLTSVSDAPVEHPVIDTEEKAERWVLSSPEAYCNTTDGKILRQVLPSFDQETSDFFRWKVEYRREELEEIVATKSGIEFGTLMDLVPLKRGPSGRIYRMKIVGSKRTVVVGKELEIRRWLSRSHLYSGAFIVRTERDAYGIPVRFMFHGAGWGHGVGLCQIGAAVMAAKGFRAEQIVKHYFRGAELQKLY